MTKLKCADCGTHFDGPADVVEKLNAAHHREFHENKQEKMRVTLQAALSMASGARDGVIPTRKESRKLAVMCSDLLNEPLTDWDEDAHTAPVTDDSAPVGADSVSDSGDSPESKPATKGKSKK